MLYKLYLTDEEFEQLNWHEQRYYFFCKTCELFYLKKDLPDGCNHGLEEGAKNPKKIKLCSIYGEFGK